MKSFEKADLRRFKLWAPVIPVMLAILLAMIVMVLQSAFKEPNENKLASCIARGNSDAACQTLLQ